MSFFKPREKELEIETQDDLPKFHFDVNGFLMFDDQSLGGCGIYEVVPTIMTGAVTHRETLGANSVDTKAKGYSPSRAMEVIGDRRRDAIMQWVSFVNGLLPDDDAESQTHVQIILKKTRPSDWTDAYGHAIDDLHGHIGAPALSLGRHGNAYRMSYEEMLDDLGKSAMSENGAWNGAAYDVLGYIVVSYTPSSEGWWLDGRDDDYYVRDTNDEQSLFSVDGMAERIGGMITERRERQEEKNDYNTARALFPIDEDRIAQVLQTRMRKIERKMSAYSQKVGNDAIAFTIRRTHMVDNSMLMSFWNDPLTSYRYKVWNMHTDLGDVILGMRNEEAVASGDIGVLSEHEASDSDMSGFLSRFAGRDASDVAADDEEGGVDDDVIDMPDDVSAAWGEISPELASSKRAVMSDEEMFMQRYRRLAISSLTTQQPNADGTSNDRHFDNDARLAGNVTYAQTTNTSNVQSAIRQMDASRRKRLSEQESDKMRELGMSEREMPNAPDRAQLDAMRHDTKRHAQKAAADAPEIPRSIRGDGAHDGTRQSARRGNPFTRAAERRDAYDRQEATAADETTTSGTLGDDSTGTTAPNIDIQVDMLSSTERAHGGSGNRVRRKNA